MLKTLLNYAPVQIASALSVFVLIALQTRYLGVEAYGVLSVYLVLVEITRTVYSQWLNTALIRHYPGADKTNKPLYASVVFSGIVGLFIPVSIFFTLALFAFFEEASWLNLTALLGLLVIKSFFIFFQEMARLNDRVSQYRRATALQSVFSMLFTWLLLERSASVDNAALGLMFSYLASIPLVWFLPSRISFNKAKPAISTLVSYGFPLMISGLIGVAGSRIDRFFIADQLGYTDAGVYSALSNMLLGLMALVFMVVALPLYPDLARKSEDKNQLFCAHQRYQIMMLTISLPALIGLCFIAEPLVRLFLGNAYLSAGMPLFWILAISAFIFNLRMHYIDHGLQFASRTNILPFILCFSLLSNVVMLFFLLPIIGVYGAAYASLACNLIALIMSFFFAKKSGHEYRLNNDTIKITIASLCMAFTLYSIQFTFFWPTSDTLQILVSIVIGVFIFALSAFVMNLMNSRKTLTNKIRKHHA